MDIAFTLYILIQLVGVTLGAIRFRRLAPSSRYLWVLLLVTLLVELASRLSVRFLGTNVLIYRIFALVQLGLLAWAYRQELRQYTNLIRLVLGAMAVYWLIDFFLSWDELTTAFSAQYKAVCNIIILILTGLYLRSLLAQDFEHPFSQYPLFWISLGWALFTVVTLVNFAAFNYIGLQGGQLLTLFGSLRKVANYVLYSSFIVAFLTPQRVLGRHSTVVSLHGTERQ